MENVTIPIPLHTTHSIPLYRDRVNLLAALTSIDENQQRFAVKDVDGFVFHDSSHSLFFYNTTPTAAQGEGVCGVVRISELKQRLSNRCL